ncbi:hypothetical protein NG99_04645 [Erwinia typographi]|uniref:Uncharacterized protein n=1 Tax=Erwinia typographi TaxID=371042 RepID=A0A0A3Z8W1_9GAMM|nr:hypothetical protein [Erwinia typographi]KGT95310.1 hypothetical protein NG99_04645 [Erwinia typographi]
MTQQKEQLTIDQKIEVAKMATDIFLKVCPSNLIKEQAVDHLLRMSANGHTEKVNGELVKMQALFTHISHMVESTLINRT